MNQCRWLHQEMVTSTNNMNQNRLQHLKKLQTSPLQEELEQLQQALIQSMACAKRKRNSHTTLESVQTTSRLKQITWRSLQEMLLKTWENTAEIKHRLLTPTATSSAPQRVSSMTSLMHFTW